MSLEDGQVAEPLPDDVKKQLQRFKVKSPFVMILGPVVVAVGELYYFRKHA